ncbi:hypothetical protein CBR_g52358 [Chara braunii]|uniref:Integrase catalytic domain-containing protein n=1 Tax=Chara braunii TaxID=69332 RepID=A0A388K6V6_CHABU|nr:hypothetical protein CBR_g52358 [Chara braunii]|eukprot:GBG65767.1 hypothetical protein CBR_g52358 [Chara braunii]
MGIQQADEPLLAFLKRLQFYSETTAAELSKWEEEEAARQQEIQLQLAEAEEARQQVTAEAAAAARLQQQQVEASQNQVRYQATMELANEEATYRRSSSATIKALDKKIATMQAEISTLHAANSQQQTINYQLQSDVSTGLTRLSAAASAGSAVADCSPALAAQAKQLEERINHVVASLGDISKFAGASTVSNQLQTLSDRVQQRPAAVAKEWKMPNFKIEKFNDYHKTDPLQWWMAFNVEADVHHSPELRRLDALYLQLIGGVQAFMTHMAVTLECTIATLHTKITWEEFEKKWKTQFMVNNDKRHALNKIFRMFQGQQPSREWLTEWQRLVVTPELNLPFDAIRAEFFARSCDALTAALGSEFQYETFDDMISKARELIQVPPPSMDGGVAVGDLCNYLAKIDREYAMQRYVDIDASLLYIRIQIGKATCSALIDCGATRNYISQDFMARVGLGPRVRRKSQPTHVTLADGHTQKSIDRYVDSVLVYFASLACEAVSFDILDTKFDMILGMSWLQSKDHPMNFYRRTVHVCDQRGELVPYEDVFQAPAGVVPDRPIRHGITLEDDAVPPRGCIYRMSEEELQVLRAQLDDLLAKGWIRPSCSPYVAPVLFVRKTNKDLCLCIDYRKLNAQTIKNAGPLPRIDDLLERLGGAKYRSTLDLKSGYHQIEIQPRDRYKTAFKTRYGHFEWIVMPFGLTNAPTTFQAVMTTEFRDLLDRTVLLYLDDILVYSRTLEEHLEHLRAILERLRIAKYKANRDKCEFAKQELEYLGQYVTPQGTRLSIAMDVTGPFPRDRLGHDGILTVVDRLSKYAQFLPCKYHATDPELARLLHTGWFCSHGVPKDIVSDCDTRFMSAFWTTLVVESGTSMKPSFARHPQTDGQTERAHQTAQMMLRTLIRPDQKDWVDRLPDIKFAYNTSVHPVIGVTPFELYHDGRKGRIFADILLPRAADIDAACSPASTRKYKELLAKARANMQKAQVRMQQQANRCRIPYPIHAGDLVWVTSKEFALEQHVSCKLLPKWFGPWKVTSAAGDDPAGPSFIIEIPPHLTVHPIFHASKLAVYTPASAADFPGRRSHDPPSMDGHQEVDRVLTHLKHGNKPMQYKVTFKQCDPDDTRWISRAVDLKATAPLIFAHYEKQRLA